MNNYCYDCCSATYDHSTQCVHCQVTWTSMYNLGLTECPACHSPNFALMLEEGRACPECYYKIVDS